MEVALAGLNPRREVKALLTPVLTALAELPERAPEARDWAVALVGRTLAPLTTDADVAREAAPAGAVFYAAFGMDAEVRTWLDHGTHPYSPRWRDRVVVALLEWCAARGDMAGAQRWLAEVQTPDMRDPAHGALAKALAATAPATAIEHLEAIEDEIRQTALAAELAEVPELTGTTEGLYGLLLILQADPDALADLLERLVKTHPDSPLVADLAQAFGGEGSGGSEGPLPAYVLRPLCTGEVVADFVGRRGRAKLATLDQRLQAEAAAAAPTHRTAVANLLLDEGLIEAEDVPELEAALREESPHD